jgi:hypothetical protein
VFPDLQLLPQEPLDPHGLIQHLLLIKEHPCVLYHQVRGDTVMIKFTEEYDGFHDLSVCEQGLRAVVISDVLSKPHTLQEL